MSDDQATVVSHSEVESYLNCRKRHYYAFGERLAKVQSPGKMNAMERGTFGHAVMEQFFLARQAGEDYDTAQQIALEYTRSYLTGPDPDFAAIMRIEQVTQHFLNTYRERVEGWEVMHLEQEFWLDLGDIKYPFKPDLIVRENGIVTLFDYKFVGIMYDDKLIALFPQLPKYMGALRAVGVEVRRAAYIFFNMHASLNFQKATPEQITRIAASDINQSRLSNSWYEQIATTHEIAEYKNLPLSEWERRATRSTGKDCNWCSFQKLCTVTLQGSDGRIIRETEFTTSTYGYTEKKESE